ncbi:MAG: fumarylacetoacetate hydrolase family protein [Phycisphaerales bacterium]|nr:fumarylacetoacetate hydrolase family protein [Phycisphaerales bacterium]
MTWSLPPAIFAIGKNYAEHAKEMGGTPPDKPTVFMKNPASVISNGEDIVIPSICLEPHTQTDYEGELAVIIGRDTKDVKEADALDCISGYAVANDVTARWWQKQGSGGQWVRGKSFDTFCPLSEPVPAAHIAPQDLTITTRVNGVMVQDDSTNNMIFSVAALIATLSTGITLLKGTVILTGTPAGVGHAKSPPSYLENGDVVEIEIKKIGLLRNTVRSAASVNK